MLLLLFLVDFVSPVKDKFVLTEQWKIPDTWKAVVAVPDFELRTEDARCALPDTYSREDLVQNIGAVSFLMAAVMMRRGELLKVGLAGSYPCTLSFAINQWGLKRQ